MSQERFHSREVIEFEASEIADALGVQHKEIKNEYIDEEINKIFLVKSPEFIPSEIRDSLTGIKTENIKSQKTHLQETEVTIIGKRLMITSYQPQTKLVLSRFSADIQKTEKVLTESGEKAVIFKSVNDSEITVYSNAFFTVNEKAGQGPSILIIDDAKKE